jgi:hypothetical protein
MARINGRIIRPSTLAERRLMFSLGLGTALRVPRSANPYAVARKLKRLLNVNPDADYLRRLGKKKQVTVPPALPDSRSDEEQAA